MSLNYWKFQFSEATANSEVPLVTFVVTSRLKIVTIFIQCAK